ncbi:MAG: hypothetical protein NC043_00815 [Muribaculaceae bacterium]|nr:hypothetical protein [Muribaculaceae bacterium]
MKRFQPILYIIAVLTGVALTGCSDDENPVSKLTYAETPDAFNYIEEAGSRAMGEPVSGVKYSMLYDDDNRTATVTMYDFRLSDDEVPAMYVFDDVEWEFSVGTPTVERIIDVPVMEASFTDGTKHSFTDVHIVYYESNELDPDGCRGFSAEFVVDGRYRVRAFPTQILCRGTTEYIESSDEGIASHAEVDYAPEMSVTFHPESLTADVVLIGFSLPDGVLSSDPIAVPGVKVSFTDTGYMLSAPGGLMPDGGAEIRSFEAMEESADELRVSFEVLNGNVTYQVRSFMRPNSYDTSTPDAAPDK